MLISNVLFECDSVSIFKIPPGPVSLRNWSLRPIVWRGSLRLVEEEQTKTASSLLDLARVLGLRLKVELYSKTALDALLDQFSDGETDHSWAEVWYNPFQENDLDYTVANDGLSSIEMTAESPKYYKIVSQLPESGYQPHAAGEKGPLLQVALGLQFEDSYSASTFLESMGIYKRHFRNFQERFLDEPAQRPSLEEAENLAVALREDGEDSDDDFGTFVGSSYD